MAFGFVVVKFSLFAKQLSLALGDRPQIQQYGYSAPIGIILVAGGALSLLLSLARYRQTARQLDGGTYRHSSTLLYGLVAFVFLAGLLLIAYLLKTT
jgi:putative membrane protein